MENFREDLRRACAGDSEAQTRLLEPHLAVLRRRVRSLLGARLNARESVSDLTQTVCCVAVRELARFQGDSSEAFRAWFLLLLNRKVRSRGRFWAAERRTPDREVDSDPDGPVTAQQDLTPSRVVAAREELDRVERALAGLSPEQREVLRLSRYEGLSHREIATRLGKSTDASRALLARALSRLSFLLAPAQPPAHELDASLGGGS